MRKYVLSATMGTVPDEMLLEAMEIKKKKNTGWTALRAAACLAVVVGLLLASLGGGASEPVTMPGVLRVYACDSDDIAEDELEQYLLVEKLEQSYKTMWAEHIDIFSKGITINLQLDDDSLSESNIVIEVSTNLGELRGNHYKEKYYVEGDLKQSKENANFGKKGAIEPGETVYWTGFEVLRLYAVGEKAGKTREETLLETGGIFIEFIVRAENNVVGYAVMEIISVDYESAIFGIELRDSAYFPKVDGEYQNVMQKYLEERIQSAKAG